MSTEIKVNIAKITAKILLIETISPKIKNAATIGKNNDNRCAASDLAIPARLTHSPIMIKTLGNKNPNDNKIFHSDNKISKLLLKFGLNKINALIAAIG